MQFLTVPYQFPYLFQRKFFEAQTPCGLRNQLCKKSDTCYNSINSIASPSFTTAFIWLNLIFVSIYLFTGCTGSQLWHENSQLWRVGSSSLTRDQIQALCIGSTESQPLDHQGSPFITVFQILLAAISEGGGGGRTSLFFYKLVISKLFSPKSLEFPLRDLGTDFKYYRLALPVFELDTADSFRLHSLVFGFFCSTLDWKLTHVILLYKVYSHCCC